MDVDREDTTSLQGGSSDVASEVAGAVTGADSTLAVPDENKNGEFKPFIRKWFGGR